MSFLQRILRKPKSLPPPLPHEAGGRRLGQPSEREVAKRIAEANDRTYRPLSPQREYDSSELQELERELSTGQSPPPLPWERRSNFPGWKLGQEELGSGWIPMDSSNVAAIQWTDDPEYRLKVKFHSGAVYAYDVPESVYDNFLTAGSPGRYVWRVLRAGRYPYAKVGA